MTCRVIVFAKAPIPGYAKTRLAKKIGDQAAAELATLMLHAAVAQAVTAQLGPVELCCSPDISHPEFAALQQQYGIELTVQGEGDLGQRMQRALARSLHHPLAPCEQVLLTGTDAPGLDAAYLQSAAAALAARPVNGSADSKPAPVAVFAPALDGGYAMIGVRQDLPMLFDAMPWSTDAVMRLSRDRLQQAGLAHVELAPLPDVDEAEDLIHLPSEWMSATSPSSPPTPKSPANQSDAAPITSSLHAKPQAQLHATPLTSPLNLSEIQP